MKAEANLRLPAAAREALAAYVKAEKANMKIYGKSHPQVVALPKLLETKFTALGYCDNDAGNLAPYCRDGCSGSRPCDKRCRRDDESCTTCGEYGVCCCLGGGGGGTPTPTPTPAPSSPMSTSEPTGTIYRSIALDDNLVFYVTAITDTAESCSCHSSSAGARIYAPWGSSSASSGMTGAYAQATARYQMSEAEFAVEQNAVVDTDHTSFCPIRGITFLAVNPRSLTPVKAFTSRYVWEERYSHKVSVDDWYWGSDAPIDKDPCKGPCMVPWILRPHDEGLGHGWVRHQGIAAKLSWGISCGGKKKASDTKPECIQPTF